MKRVLLVDDQKQFLKSLKFGLDAFKAKFRVATAENGKEAVKVLESNTIDLVVTDLRMPQMDGFELLVYLKANFPSIPIIVMSAFATPEVEQKIKSVGILGLLEKPVNFDVMANAIVEGLEIGSEEGSLTGISLPSFLQLLEIEQKTCLLEIYRVGRNRGFFYFKEGVLFDAVYGDMHGDEAAIKMIGMDNIKISFKKLPDKEIKRRIKRGITSLLMDGMRQKDEFADRNGGSEVKSGRKGEGATETGKEDRGKQHDTKRKKGKLSSKNDPRQSNDAASTKEINQMALENYLEDFKTIKGYRAAAIMNFTGEVLVSDSNDKRINLDLVGATFNDIFRSAHEASEKIGFKACQETVIQTPLGTIVMCCSGVDSKVHFHTIGILSNDGNQALMKMQLEKIMPKVMEELA